MWELNKMNFSIHSHLSPAHEEFTSIIHNVRRARRKVDWDMALHIIYTGMLQARLMSLHACLGEVMWDFNNINFYAHNHLALTHVSLQPKKTLVGM